MAFCEEFQHLLRTKPRYNLKQTMAENCDYADTAVKSRSCYWCFGIFYSEDVYYARYSRKCTSCGGLTFCVGCEWCTECIDCADCYMADYCQDCQNCSECQFCKDCFGCRNCFGCVGLYQRQFCTFNEQLTKEEYADRITSLNLMDATHREAVQRRVEELRKKAVNLGVHQYSSENCIGNHLTECARCYRCHDSFALEDCLYCIETNGNKDCCDLTVCFEAELCYQCMHSPLNYNCNYLFHCDACADSEYCAFSKNLKHCFGCVYMQDKEYYILNKGPYGAEDYIRRTENIRRELPEQGRYNLLPYFLSDYEQRRLRTETDSVIQSLPPSSLVTQNADSQRLTCRNPACGKDFLVIAQEAAFYGKKKLPLPDHCPACRHRQRMALRSERQLYDRMCDKCQKPMLSVYPKEAPYVVYCHQCFWKNIG